MLMIISTVAEVTSEKSQGIGFSALLRSLVRFGFNLLIYLLLKKYIWVNCPKKRFVGRKHVVCLFISGRHLLSPFHKQTVHIYKCDIIIIIIIMF